MLDSTYLSPEILHILLFSKKNVVIKNYCNIEKFNELISVIQFYNIIKLDLNEISDATSLSALAEKEDYEKKNIFIFHNPTIEHLVVLKSIKTIKYIIILNGNSELIQFYDDLGEVVYYNLKRNSFNPPVSDSLLWENFVIQKIRDNSATTVGLSNAQEEVNRLCSKIHKIYISIIEDSGKEANRLIKLIFKDYNFIDKKKIALMIERHIENFYEFQIRVGQNGLINKNNTKNPSNSSKLSNPNKIPLNSDFDSKSAECKSRNQDTKKLKLLKKFNSEIESIQKTNSNLYWSFLTILEKYAEKIANPSESTNIFSPQGVYHELRLNAWKDEISSSFLQDWFSMHMMKTIGSIEKEIKAHTSEFDQLINMQYCVFLEVANKLPGKCPKFDILNAIVYRSFTMDTDGFKCSSIRKANEKSSNEKNHLKNSNSAVHNAVKYIKDCIKNKEIHNYDEFFEKIETMQQFLLKNANLSHNL